MIINKKAHSIAVLCTIMILITVCIIDFYQIPKAYAYSNGRTTIICQEALSMKEEVINQKIKEMIAQKERKRKMLLEKRRKKERMLREKQLKLQRQKELEQRKREFQNALNSGDYAKAIYSKASQRGLNADMAVAISKLETGHWTSSAFLNYNNFGGLMGANGLMIFSSKEEGLNAFLNTLESYRGMSIEDMGKIYCTDGSDWSGMVTSLMY